MRQKYGIKVPFVDDSEVWLIEVTNNAPPQIEIKTFDTYTEAADYLLTVCDGNGRVERL